MEMILRYINKSEGSFKLNYSLKTKDILKLCDNEFILFKNNFEKNNNSFPYVGPNVVNYIAIESGKNICGILVYAYHDKLLEYRENHDDNKHDEYAHIFDLEVSQNYRGKKLSEKLINACIEKCKKHNETGITLQGIDERAESMYDRKFGFKTYDNELRYMALNL